MSDNIVISKRYVGSNCGPQSGLTPFSMVYAMQSEGVIKSRMHLCCPWFLST